MALQLPLLAADSLVGDDFPNAYAKVEFYRGWSDRVLIAVNWFADAEARAMPAQPVRQGEFLMSHEVGAAVSYPMFYAHLKSLPEFAGAVDV
jgi:hypothetical protein